MSGGKRSLALDNEDSQDEVASSPAVAVKATLRKGRRPPENEADVYDDIDGALTGDTPSNHLRTWQAGTTIEITTPAAPSPARRRSARGKAPSAQANGTPQEPAQDTKAGPDSARRSGGRGARLLAEFKLVKGVSPKKVDTPSRRKEKADDSRAAASEEPEAEVVKPQDEAESAPAIRKRRTPSRTKTPKSVRETAGRSGEPAQPSVTRKTRGWTNVAGNVESASDDESAQEVTTNASKPTTSGEIPRRSTRKVAELGNAVHGEQLTGLDQTHGAVQRGKISQARDLTQRPIPNSNEQGLESGLDSRRPKRSKFLGRLLGNDTWRPPQDVEYDTASTPQKLDEPIDDTSQGDEDQDTDRTASAAVSSATSPPSTGIEATPRGVGFVQEDSKARLGQHVLTVHSPARLLATVVMEKLTGKRPIPLIGLGDEYSKVHQLVEQTVNAGEGNSMLLIGARGSGKSALVNKVVSDLSKDNRENFHIIQLNGFIHTDDKLALREVWRQLGKEIDMDEDALGKNYADTLSKLLALLSHPSELAGEESDQVAKAVVFVMDEFDLFASHPRQTLLYNLFDIAQSRKAPIAVLGLTTKLDVSESLEKRVKSRFSHRYVHLSVAKNFQVYQEICKSALQIKAEELNVAERATLAQPAKTPQKGKGSKEMSALDVLADWNSSVSVCLDTLYFGLHLTRPQTLFANATFLSTHLAPHYKLTKSVPSALSMFLLPISHLSTSSAPSLSPTDFPTASTPEVTLAAPDSSLSLLPTLPTLALALLIAAARLDIILDTPTTNFNMAYAEYVSLASTARIQSAAGGALATGGVGGRLWGRDVATGEWERLVGCGLLIPVLGGGGAVTATSMVRCDVSLEEIGAVGGLETGMAKWCRQI